MTIRNNAAIIYSEESRQAFIADARKRGQIYRFRGSSGVLHWLRGDVAYLAVNGVASLLRRFGVKFDILTEDKCSVEVLNDYHTIFVPNACRLLEQTSAALEKWLEGDVELVVSGSTNLPERLLGIRGNGQYTPRAFCGIKWLPSLRFNPQHEDYVFSPPGYRIPIISSEEGTLTLGKLVEYQDVEETENRVCLNGDAIVIGEKTIYFAFPLFDYVGGILQGHICIEPLRKFLEDEGNFYVDRLAWYVKQILFHYGCQRLWQVQLKPWGEYDNVLVLRHDTDESADPSYLEYESANETPATYAILPDRNREFYLSQVAACNFLEASYHYTTVTFRPWSRKARLAKKAITGQGLAKQAKRSKEKFGIYSNTLHRHAVYFCYPETIEAVHYLYENMPEIIGMGTMFRFTNMKYSGDESLDESYTVNHPDVSVPFWFPFKMVVSSVQEHKLLRGWDIGQFIEPAPQISDMVFNNSALLPNGVYMLGFHPAHARRDTFNPGGNYEWFLYSIDKARKHGWWITNYKRVCQRLNDWEALTFNIVDDGSIVLYNPTTREILDLVISRGDKIISVVSDNGEVNFKDTYIQIPVIKGQSTIKIRYEYFSKGQE